MKMTALFCALQLLTVAAAQAKEAGYAQPPAAEFARMAPPQPPDTNPHPPQTAEDKRRVDFAVAEIRAYYGPGVEIRHPHIIPWSFQNYLKNRQAVPVTPGNPNVIVEAQTQGASSTVPAPEPSSMAMGPALQPDEYMVHVYARFQGDPAWYHLDVILTEDAAGNPIRRRFFRIPMPPTHSQLPPGVVC